MKNVLRSTMSALAELNQHKTKKEKEHFDKQHEILVEHLRSKYKISDLEIDAIIVLTHKPEPLNPLSKNFHQWDRVQQANMLNIYSSMTKSVYYESEEVPQVIIDQCIAVFRNPIKKELLLNTPCIRLSGRLGIITDHSICELHASGRLTEWRQFQEHAFKHQPHRHRTVDFDIDPPWRYLLKWVQSTDSSDDISFQAFCMSKSAPWELTMAHWRKSKKQDTLNHTVLRIHTQLGSSWSNFFMVPNDGYESVKNEEEFITARAGEMFYQLYLKVIGSGNQDLKDKFGAILEPVLTRDLGEVLKTSSWDVQYFDPALVVWSVSGIYRALIKMGVMPEHLFPILTRKEVYKFLDNLDRFDLKGGGTLKERSEKVVLAHFFHDHPDAEFLNSALRYTSNRTVLEWALYHKAQITRQFEYNANGRAYCTDSFHLLRGLTEADFPNGLKTSFYTVQEQSVRNNYKDNLPDKDTPLPVFTPAIDDSRIQQIVTSEGLLQESINMRHCVATYYHKCKRGDAFIFHVDDGSSKGVTVELGVCSGKGAAVSYYIEQIQSYGSADITEAKKIMTDFLDSLPQ